ncbi:MAG TPA: CARDB domain-containing protein [Thermoplasmata archaeon]|nr:CARDB domain-containing protein [Thermoplasmata archaeon]
MSRRWVSFLLVLLLVGPTFVVGLSVLAAPVRAAATLPVTGSITGPSVVSTNSTDVFHVSGYGGPAVSESGSLVGNLTYYATPVGPNLTEVRFTPGSEKFSGNQSIAANLVPGNATETISIDIMISSTYHGQNESINISYSVSIVQPYVITATIVNPTNVTVSAFAVYVTLDGTAVGQVNVSGLAAEGSTRIEYRYPTLGLSTGSHTFTLSLVQSHGLVTFANGQSVYSLTVYVTGPAPDYTLWYVVGIVAFFGAVFIFVSRVAARRRGAIRR